MVLDPGLSVGALDSIVASAGSLVDAVKLGWGSALATPDLTTKLRCLAEHGIDHYFGGTLFELFMARSSFDDYLRFCDAHGCRIVEISDGTVAIPPAVKAACITTASRYFTVLSEVGSKDPVQSTQWTPADWVGRVEADLAAGADRVVTETRESGRGGICAADGSILVDALEAILGAGISPDSLIFEAPTRALQAYFVTRIGTEVNLGNIAPADIIGLESLRLELRFDTMTDRAPAPVGCSPVAVTGGA